MHHFGLANRVLQRLLPMSRPSVDGQHVNFLHQKNSCLSLTIRSTVLVLRPLNASHNFFLHHIALQ